MRIAQAKLYLQNNIYICTHYLYITCILIFVKTNLMNVIYTKFNKMSKQNQETDNDEVKTNFKCICCQNNESKI